MSDPQSNDRRSTFWTVLGALLAIFGATFAVVTYVVPAESTIEKLALSLVVVSASALIFRAIQVLLAGRRIDLLLSVLTFVTVGLMAWYTIILVASREAKIEALEQQTSTASPPETGSSVGQGNISPQAPKESIPSGLPLPSFAPSAEEVYSSGTVTLRLGGQEGLKLSDWSVGNGSYSPIVFTKDGLVGRNTTELGLLTEGSDTSFATCRDHIAWTPVINWQQVRRGSFACLRWEGRRGILRIDTIPNFGENRPSVELPGRVWTQIVDY